MEAFGKYYGDLRVACERGHKAGKVSFAVLLSLLVSAWVLFPVGVATLLHPTQAIGFLDWSGGEVVPRFYTWHMAIAGAVYTALAIGALSVTAFLATVLLFRRAKFFVKLWPIPGVLLGLVGNGLFWLHTGFFDRPGALCGMSALAFMVICEAICEQLGGDFVWGKGNRPSRDESQSWG